ncbi:MAG: GNAT family N-acetyltransferase [bacterium]
MSEVLIRPYHGTDREALVRLFEQFLDYLVALDPLGRLRREPGYGEFYVDNVCQLADSGGTFLVAELEGQIIGLAAGAEELRPESYLLDHHPSRLGRVEELYMSDAARGTGVGKRLLAAVEDFLAGLGCDTVVLSVMAANQLARDFYKSQGYRPRDIEMLKVL